MTTVAIGGTAAITLGDGGYIRVASNGGFWAAAITPTVGAPTTPLYGPGQVRTVLGPFAEGATVLLNATNSELRYDAFIVGNGSSDIAAGATSTLTIPSAGALTIASNIGFFAVSVTAPGEGTKVLQFGPSPVRTTFGPYANGASITVTSVTAAINCNVYSPNGAPPYEANVASRTKVPNLYISSATATWGNFQTVDYARAEVSGSVRVVVPNYRYNAATEVGPSASARFRISIEYPIGSTPQRFPFTTFSGDQYNGIVGNNAQVFSLPITLNTTIPKGAKFYWHVQFECTGGIACNQTTAYLADDMVELSTSPLPDRTAVGSSTPYGTPSTGQTLGPLVFLATTTSASIGGQGNSNMLGAIQLVTTTFPASDEFGYQGFVGRSIAPSLPFMNLGSYGDTIAAFIGAQGTKRRVLLDYCSHIVTEMPINDLVIGGRTAAQAYADLTTLRQMFPTKKFYACKLGPNTTGAWTNPDGSDQVLGAAEAQRAALNALLDANAASFDGIFQTDAAVSLPGKTKWLAPGYTNEGTHYTVLAQLAVRDSGAINPAVFTR